MELESGELIRLNCVEVQQDTVETVPYPVSKVRDQRVRVMVY